MLLWTLGVDVEVEFSRARVRFGADASSQTSLPLTLDMLTVRKCLCCLFSSGGTAKRYVRRSNCSFRHLRSQEHRYFAAGSDVMLRLLAKFLGCAPAGAGLQHGDMVPRAGTDSSTHARSEYPQHFRLR